MMVNLNARTRKKVHASIKEYINNTNVQKKKTICIPNPNIIMI